MPRNRSLKPRARSNPLLKIKTRILPIRMIVGYTQHTMGQPTRSRFVRRHNQDGSHDSICTECVSMVASVENEWELPSHELMHVCDPVHLYRVSQGRSEERRGGNEGRSRGSAD